MPNRLRVGIAGFGYWGPNLARVLDAMPAVEMVAVADPSSERCEFARKEFKSSRIYSSIHQMLNEANLQAIVIATPANFHFNHSLLALNKGAHVLVEKPMVTSSSEGMKLLEMAKDANRILMPGHTFLYNSAIQKAKELISLGVIGNVMNIYSQRLNLGRLRNDINVIWNLAPHDISIFNFLLDSNAVEVSATGGSILTREVEDIAFLTLEYPNNVLCHSHLSLIDPTKTRRITVIGSKGMITVDDTKDSNMLEVHEKFVDALSGEAPRYENFNLKVTNGRVHFPLINKREPLQVEIEDFINCINHQKTPFVTAIDGIRIAEDIEAATLSLKLKGQPIKIVRNQI